MADGPARILHLAFQRAVKNSSSALIKDPETNAQRDVTVKKLHFVIGW